jgi:hypothetical protein
LGWAPARTQILEQKEGPFGGLSATSLNASPCRLKGTD